MKVLVIGAGTMGAGIAQVFAAKGNHVVLCDVNRELVQKGLASIQKNLEKLVSKEKISAAEKDGVLSGIETADDIESGGGCDLAVEAVMEDMQIKKQIFAKLDAVVSGEALLASNTSSLSITEIGSCTRHPERVIGMHFFNPAPVMKLVEIIKGIATDDSTVNRLLEITKDIGKEGIVVNESSGFVVNRMLIPMINEAIGILSEGVASAEDIDKAMVYGANHPIGPLALADMIGNDVNLAIMNELYRETGDPKYRAHPLLKKMVRAGYLGRKSGRGFFTY